MKRYLKQNTQIVGSHSKIFTARESIIHGQPLILNVCNSFKQDEKQSVKQGKSQSDKTIVIDLQCQKRSQKDALRLTITPTGWLSHQIPSQTSPSWASSSFCYNLMKFIYICLQSKSSQIKTITNFYEETF
jgi:hypothetical protein